MHRHASALAIDLEELRLRFEQSSPPPTLPTRQARQMLIDAADAVRRGDVEAERLVHRARRMVARWLYWTTDDTVTTKAVWVWRHRFDSQCASQGWDAIDALDFLGSPSHEVASRMDEAAARLDRAASAS